MISRENYKKVRIRIRTYKLNKLQTYIDKPKMEQDKKTHKNPFICSLCLTPKNKILETERKSKALIKKGCDICLETSKALMKVDNKINNDKSVQTSYTDLNKSLNLLNEVLTVFQNKKQGEIQTKSKTIILKDANISTENVRESKPKLTVSKLFQFCVDELVDKNHKTIITSHDDCLKTAHSELPKHKASSVPQMKMDELKNLIKEKPKSKDAIDEVNRMFATVKKVRRNIGDCNRPLVRHGPRLLPFVRGEAPSESDDLCKCCQTKDCLSSGDSFSRPEYHSKNSIQNCEKCVYVMCCNYKNHRKMQGGVMYCDRCQDKSFRCNFEGNNFENND